MDPFMETSKNSEFCIFCTFWLVLCSNTALFALFDKTDRNDSTGTPVTPRGHQWHHEVSQWGHHEFTSEAPVRHQWGTWDRSVTGQKCHRTEVSPDRKVRKVRNIRNFWIFLDFLEFCTFPRFPLAWPKDAVQWWTRTHTTGGYQGSTDLHYPITRVPPHPLPDAAVSSSATQRCLRGLSEAHQASFGYRHRAKIPSCPKPPLFNDQNGLVENDTFVKNPYSQ